MPRNPFAAVRGLYRLPRAIWFKGYVRPGKYQQQTAKGSMA